MANFKLKPNQKKPLVSLIVGITLYLLVQLAAFTNIINNTAIYYITMVMGTVSAVLFMYGVFNLFLFKEQVNSKVK